MLRFSLVTCACVFLATPVLADSWPDAMFDEHAKDFGAVPHGSLLSHPFRITNTTRSTVHISGASVSCGCVTPTVLRDTLAPGQSTAVLAQMDSGRFFGFRRVDVYVRFDQPSWGEVHLSVQANSRDDLYFSPQSIELGKVEQGSAPSASVNVTLFGEQSKITGVQPESNYLETNLKEVRGQNGEVSYRLTAGIRNDTPAGRWYSEIWLKTNNASLPRIRIPVNVEVIAPLRASATTVQLGDIKPGALAEHKVTLKGTKPFRITRVEGTNSEWEVTDDSKDEKAIHVLTIRVKPTKTGELSHKLKVTTDLKNQSIELMAKGQVK
jgi:hypothetical protein